MKRLFAAAVALMLLAALPAFAADAPKPAELKGHIAAAAPYGSGSLSKLFLHVYDSSLWTDAAPWSADKPYALVIRYDMNFKVKELTDRSISEMERSGKMTDAEKAQYRQDLSTRFHDVKPGDTITALYEPKKGGSFYYNGKIQGDVMDATRAKRFLMIWLGPETSEPALRRQLLNLK
ncbi:MAG: chalcone isomerase family protein [Micavibrio sp.]|nr:chalcone isomerase family protein [Micavibrio sp.]